ncbi:MAG: BMC domain-containing protein [Firmicutes bacterium]|nr:BMC domain-containing protein [Bacillota bacterium]
MLITCMIRAPRPGTMAMLLRRMAAAARKDIEGRRFDAIGLVQTDLARLFYFADVGQKAGDVLAMELTGDCPQRMSTIAFFGDTAAVDAALAAVEAASATGGKR